MRRYIDADSAIVRISKIVQNDWLAHELKEAIKNIPTADVRENVKGEWIELRNGVKRCSVCKFTSNHLLTDNFCPNCGAKLHQDITRITTSGADMRGEAE